MKKQPSSAKRTAAEAKAIKARSLEVALKQQQAASEHEELVARMHQWHEAMADWPADCARRPVALEAASSGFAKRVHALCTLGIPPKIRGAVWPLLIGNALEVTREQFEAYKEEVDMQRKALVTSSTHSEGALSSSMLSATPPRGSLGRMLPDVFLPLGGATATAAAVAAAAEGGGGSVFVVSGGLNESTPPRAEKREEEKQEQQPESKENSRHSLGAVAADTSQTVTSLLRWDLPRTFPTLKFFHDDGHMRASLERVLYTYVLYAPETGYVQGMSFVAAMLLLNLDEADAFACLANLLHRRGLKDFMSLQREHVDAYVACFDHFFQQSLPLLFNHLRSECVSSEMFLLDWYLAMFTKALPLEVAARVWDCYLAEGELFGLKISLGILRLFAAKLCNLRTEGIMAFLVHLPEDVDADKLLQSAHSIAISQGHFERVRTSLSGSGPATVRPTSGNWQPAPGASCKDDPDPPAAAAAAAAAAKSSCSIM